MTFGLSSSEELIRQLSDKEFRDEFVADQVRSRIALMIRALREERGLSQSELGRCAGKPQNVVSRLENPDYGKESLQTLLEMAAAFDLPLLVDIPEWDDWLERTRQVDKSMLARTSFNAGLFVQQAKENKASLLNGKLTKLRGNGPITGSNGGEKIVGDGNLRLVGT
ncbi:helix-turn-helix domain-containing protein [Phenylobacterium sp.]|uniref:helix-turn-helix domain-containing protein n=1 Tax=Phenylobacterium sp. TaxID=1871053 RepID=UPI00374D90EE